MAEREDGGQRLIHEDALVLRAPERALAALGQVVDEPVVVDRGVITSRGRIDLAAFTEAVIGALVEAPTAVVSE